MAKTSASFTIMDYTDGISLITGIDANLPLTSQYDPTTQTLNPSWAGSTSLILTPKVLKAGTSQSLIATMTSKTWKRRLVGQDWVTVTSGSNGETVNSSTGEITVSQDKLLGNTNQIEYMFSGIYTDPILNLPFPVEIKVTLSRVQNGTSVIIARAYATGGTTFKNEQPASLICKAELIRGATHDTTNLEYQWAKSINGVDWSNLTGKTSDTLSVSASDVNSFAMFRCTIKDVDPSSDSYDRSFTTEGVSFYDVSDPYQAVIESTGGNFFKNKTGTTVLVCKVYQNGVEIDPTGSTLTYTWTKTNKNGDSVSFTPSATSVGDIVASNKKAITVGVSEVDVKATFFCSVN